MNSPRNSLEHIDWSKIDYHIYESVDTSSEYLVVVSNGVWATLETRVKGEQLDSYMTDISKYMYENSTIRVYKLVEIYEQIE